MAIAVAWVVVVVLAAALADLLPLEDPREIPTSGATFLSAFRDWHHILGTDGQARDELTRLIYGARVSLVVGVGAAALGMVIGGAIGMLMAMAGPRIRMLLDIGIDSALAFPPLVLLVGLVAVMRPNLTSVLVGLTLLSTPVFARLVRTSAATVLAAEYVFAARAMGATWLRLAVREVVPNVANTALSYAFVLIGVLITGEASLSFLGLSVQPPFPTWGGMVAESQTTFEQHPHGLIVPAAAIFVTVLAFSAIGLAAGRRGAREPSRL
jgi:peptide/nickel transport system permease protein